MYFIKKIYIVYAIIRLKIKKIKRFNRVGPDEMYICSKGEIHVVHVCTQTNIKEHLFKHQGK